MRLLGVVLFIALLTAAPLPLVAAEGPEEVTSFGPGDAPRRLLVRGTTDIPVFRTVLQAFSQTLPYLRIDYEQWSANALNARTEADCNAHAPGADFIINSGIDRMLKLVNDGCALPHRTDATASIPQGSHWRSEIFAITAEPGVIIYNRQLVPPEEVPRTRFDLIDLLRPVDSRYAGRVATYDIEASGTGYIYAFADSLQASTFGSLIEAFGRSGAVATCCSAELIGGVQDGTYLIGYNVLGSYAAARAAEDPLLGVVLPEDYTLILSRAAMIPKGAANVDDAGAFIDFLLGAEGRNQLNRTRLLLKDDDGDARGGMLRPVPLSPVLLVAVDAATRQQFLARWRSAFPKRTPAFDAPQGP
ncbi:ABC transporter substrate-binding protein [Xanthobacter sp. AM11]|uniref:ABC transporter substrate-binding protein n=1 Tax=Xanthobacter sp. AM11 TaxID=3380643 RepID=UPI0039C00015